MSWEICWFFTRLETAISCKVIKKEAKMQKKKKKKAYLWKYKSGISESYHFNFWDWDCYWLFEGLSTFRINNNNNKMDSLIPTRLLMLKRVTEGSFWKESKQVPFPMISVLRTACSSTHSQSRSWWGAKNPWEMAHRWRKVQHVGFLKVERPLTPLRINFKIWAYDCQYKLYHGLSILGLD